MTDTTDVVGTQIVYLNSDPKQTIQTFDFDIDVLSCEPDETLAISLLQCCFNKNDAYVINETNNTLSFKQTSTGITTEVSITPGTYNYTDFAAQVSAQFSACKCLYMRSQKILSFHFTENYQISFEDLTHAQTFGFTELTSSIGSTITSTQVLDFRFSVNNVAIHMYGMSLARQTYDNFSNGQVVNSTVLGLIPWSTSQAFSPFNYIVGAPYELQLQDKNISQLHVEITDLQRNALPQINDYTLVLKMTTYKEKKNEMLVALKNLVSMKKVGFISKYMHKK